MGATVRCLSNGCRCLCGWRRPKEIIWATDLSKTIFTTRISISLQAARFSVLLPSRYSTKSAKLKATNSSKTSSTRRQRRSSSRLPTQSRFYFWPSFISTFLGNLSVLPSINASSRATALVLSSRSTTQTTKKTWNSSKERRISWAKLCTVSLTLLLM